MSPFQAIEQDERETMKKIIVKRKVRRKKKIPTVSVVMPVYNAGPYLAHAINSILKQTFKDFEFIIIDDHSTDKSWEIIQRYAKRYPNKIRAFRNEKNLKQAKTVNLAMKLTRGDYIARMDADDIAMPTKFEKQLAHLEANPKTVAVGSQCYIIDERGKAIGEKKFPTEFEDIYQYIFKFCPAQQPTFMIAKKRLPKNLEFYDQSLAPVEDVEFLFKLFKYGRVENMPDFLHLYRIHGKNSSLTNLRKSFILTLISRFKGVAYHGYKPTFTGILYTIAQFFAILILPEKVSYNLYKIIKSDMNKPAIHKNTNRRLSYQLSKAI